MGPLPQRQKERMTGRVESAILNAMEDAPAYALVPGRSCEGCTACCKLTAVQALNKPPSVWCEHCDKGVGCNIYETRPDECRVFYCGWVTNPVISEAWRPEKSKMVIIFATKRIAIYVDKDRRDAWRKAPYITDIRNWAAQAVSQNADVIVYEGLERIRVYPNGEQRLGPAKMPPYS
jgi:hypothetical protein